MMIVKSCNKTKFALEKRITSNDAGISLSQFLQLNYPQCSRRSLRRQIDDGAVFINDRPIRLAKAVLLEGDCIQCQSPVRQSEKRFLPIKALWEDDRYCVVFKPAGIESDKIPALFDHPFLTLLHRLDKGTSGVLLMAKDRASAQRGWDCFRKRRVVKSYLALIEGAVQLKKTVCLPQRPRLQFKLKPLWELALNDQKASDTAVAITHFETLKSQGAATWLWCRPHTGRTHQIRLHAAYLGHPIVGDVDYGDGSSNQISRLMLHAHRVIIPELGIDVSAKLPGEMSAVAGKFNAILPQEQLNDLEKKFVTLSHQ